jgi:serine protease
MKPASQSARHPDPDGQHPLPRSPFPQSEQSVSAPEKLRPARTLLGLGLLSLLLVACPQPPQPPPPIVVPPPAVSILKDQTVPLGAELSSTVQQAFGGSWSLEGLPVWLSAAPISGVGNLNTVLMVSRRAAVPTSASQPTLSGTVKVVWKAQDGASTGSVSLKVSADLYRLTGRVQDSLSSLSADDVSASTAGRLRTQSVQRPGIQHSGTRGVLVVYRSQAASLRAQRAGGLHAVAPQVVSLRTDDVAGTIARLQAQPDVAYAVPEAVLSATDLGQPVQQVQGAGAASAVNSGTLGAQQVLSAPLNPTDEYAPLQWAFKLLGYPAVWRDMQKQPYARPVTVAVLDSGVRYDHPDLKGRLYGPGDGALDLLSYSKNSAGAVMYDNGDGDGPDADPTDPATPGRSDISHGTHVTGIIAANWGTFAPPCAKCSGSGVVGAIYNAPVKVLPVRVLDAPTGDGGVGDISLAIRYAAGESVILSDGKTYTNPHPAQVINMSLGGLLIAGTPEGAANIKVLCDAVARATTLGALVVASGGNGSGTLANYPAACPGAVSVAAVSLSDGPAPIHAYYSDSYQQVALSAPGGQPGTSYNGGTLNGLPMQDLILSTGWDYARNEPGYYLEAGTSQAAPQVTALAALLLSKGVAATPSQALDRMLATASDLGEAGRDSTYGVGLINPAAALGVAPVSNTLGLNVQDAQGRSYLPVLDSVGRFTAYLPDGAVRVVAGRDSNGNGLAGETSEPRVEASAVLGPALTSIDIGTLTP